MWRTREWVENVPILRLNDIALTQGDTPLKKVSPNTFVYMGYNYVNYIRP